MRGVGCRCVGEAHSLDAPVALRHQLVGPIGDPAGGIGVGRSTMRRVVFEATVGRRIVRGRDHDAVGLPAAAARPAVVAQDGERDRRRRGESAVDIDHRGDTVAGQHLEGRGHGRLGQCVGVLAEEQRTVDALSRPILTDGLGGGCDVVFVERPVEARAPVPRRSERHPLVGVGRVGVGGEVGGDERRHIDEVFGEGELSGTGMRHALMVGPPSSGSCERRSLRPRERFALRSQECASSWQERVSAVWWRR